MKCASLITLTLLSAVLSTPAFAQPGTAARYNWSKDNTSGWTLMTAQERTEHQSKMRAAKTYEECKALQDEHHQAMEARAKEKGLTLRPARRNGCDVMKARGILK